MQIANRNVKKMLNISNHKRNANQTHYEISQLSKKKKKIATIGKDMEKLKPLRTEY